MAGAYSQDLRDRVIDAVIVEGMSRRTAAERFGVSESSAINWVERFERSGSRTARRMGGHLRPKLELRREFLAALRSGKPDITLQALCDRLLAERGVKADTSMMSRFFRREDVTLKKRRSSHVNRTVPT
jgi:transposase